MKALMILAALSWAIGGASGADLPVKKWHPGIYFVGYPDHFREPRWTDDVIGSRLAGVTLRLKWRQIETTRGVYDFSLIRELLAKAATGGKYLGVHVEDKSWGSPADGGKCVPDYMIAAEFGGGQMTRTKPDGGAWCSAARWNAAAMDRFIALQQSLAKEFDGHPNFVWVQTTESATSMGPQLTRADRDALVVQMNRLVDAMGAAWVQTAWGLSLNWDVPDLPALLDRVRAAGGGVTWPDSTPVACEKCAKTPLYSVIGAYKGAMPIAPSVEYSDLTGKDHPLRDKWDCGGHPCTWQDVHDQTVAWGAQMVQWPPSGWGETPATNFNFRRDLVPILDAAGWKAADGCPTNIRCGKPDPVDEMLAGLAALRTEVAAMQSRLAADAESIAAMISEQAAQRTDLAGVRDRLNAAANALTR